HSSGNGGGGGGGGWYGGGGGKSGGGGGGSSYTNPQFVQNTVHQRGYNVGSGQILISFSTACTFTPRVPVVVTVNPIPTITINASADTVCADVQLTASGANTYIWNATPATSSVTKVAAGLRRLNTTYNGPAIQLRRPSDNVVQDFGFSGSELNLPAIEAFLNGETGRCSKLYDQSGSGNHFVQTDTSRQPLFVPSGINGHPVLRVSATPARFMTNAVTVAPPYTVVYTARQNGPARGRMLSTISSNWLLGWHGGNKRMAHFDSWVSPSGGIAADANTYVYSATRSATTSKVYENSTLLYSNGAGGGSILGLQMNGYQGNANELSDGDFGDIVVAAEVLADVTRAAFELSQQTWYGLSSQVTGANATFSPAGPYTTYLVSGTAANGCAGNNSKVIVVDGKPPTVQCAADQELILNASCQATLPDYRSLLTVSDNCTPTPGLVITQTPAAGTVITGLDTIVVQFFVRDGATFESACSLQVFTRDTTAVRIQCPAARSVGQEVNECGAHVTLVPATASNCRSVSIMQTGGPASGALFPTGTTAVTYTASDLNGNTASCSYNVIVVPLLYSVSGEDTVCSGQTATLQLDSLPVGTTVNWYSAPGGGSLIATGNPVSNIPVGTIYARFQAPCGQMERAVTVVSSDSIPLLITGDSLICPATRSILTATGIGSVGWASLGLPVDAAPVQAQAAVGLRLLNGSYTGPLVRVRRATDGAEQNFGALGMNLDTAAIRNWLGISLAYCVTLFDQSGSGRDITQGTPSAQPQLILRSTLNDRPALRFSTSQFMQAGSAFTLPYSITVVGRQTGGTRARVLSSVTNNWLLGWHGGKEAQAFFSGWVYQSGPAAGNAMKVYTGTSDGTVSSFYENGLLLASNSGGIGAPGALQLNGYVGNSERSDCEINELIVFGAVLADSALVQVERSAIAYFVASNQLLVAAPSRGQTQTFSAVTTNAVCNTTLSTSVTIRSAAVGNPNEFGNGVWNVYVWGKGGSTINASAWNDSYSGYYSQSGISFNSSSLWNDAPSSASGYQGCAVGNIDHSWSAKRKGFPCAPYNISIDSHDDASQLWINGVKVWEHNACCDNHLNVWQGTLGPNDSVEFRVTQGVGGSGGAISITDLSTAYSLTYPITSTCHVSSNVTATVSQSGAVFTASPAGLQIDPSTGLIQVSASAPGIYTVTASWPLPCGTSITKTAPFTIIDNVGDPTVFGSNEWSVYVWDAGDGSLTGGAWSNRYAGYYTATGINFNSTAQWASGTAPSSAPGYQGCVVGATNNSWSAKRQGFPCDYYSISVSGHDDAAQLWVNGVKVWEHNGCCDNHANVWQGSLGAGDSVEFRVAQGTGGGFGSIEFASGPGVRYDASPLCTSASVAMPAVTITGGFFTATPAGLLIDSTTGAITPSGSLGGNYTVTHSIVGPCGDTVSSTGLVTIIVPSGDPSVAGTSAWNVYVWGAGNISDTLHSWNTAYAGTLQLTPVNFYTLFEWRFYDNPSEVPGYQGCPVNTSNFSWLAKRTGFNCGRYRISVPDMYGSGQLWISGTLVAYLPVGSSAATRWEGYLTPTDVVELRVRGGDGYGTEARIVVQAVSDNISFSYPSSQYCASAAPVAATMLPTITGSTGGTFSASPAGLTIDATTGNIDFGASQHGDYTITYTFTTPCAAVLTSSVPMSYHQIVGDPNVFGSNQWNVYVWNSGGVIDSTTWLTNYSGYYVDTSLNLYSTDRWNDGAAPSTASGYTGCFVDGSNNSWSAKRKGFPCGYYHLNVDSHDDGGQLWVNGVKVWEHSDCCDSHPDVWQGMLGPTDSVEFRVTQGVGGANGRLSVVLGPPTVIYANGSYCSTVGVVNPATQLSGGTYTATPAGLSINAATGAVDAANSLGGTYTISLSYPTACGDTLQGTGSITIVTPAGDPAVAGNGNWNIYVWAAGDQSDTTHSWNTAYAGYLTAVGLSSTLNFINGTLPSDFPSYQGCPLADEKYSWTMKRTGIACGRYSINVITNIGSAQIFINGVRVQYLDQNIFNNFSPQWRGYLAPSDVVEIRMRSVIGLGSRLRLQILQIAESVSISYPSPRYCITAGTPGLLTPVLEGIGSGTYTATPAGLSIDAATGVIDQATSSFGSYTITFTGSSVCGTAVTASTSVSLQASAGDPAVFGSDSWNVYAWNAGNISGTPWSSNYAGYYTVSTLNLNTADQWSTGGSPSDAPGYTGCTVEADNHSWSAKRKGFPCGRYQLNVPDHDDEVELWVDGVKVFNHDFCCDSHDNAWTGILGPESKVEFRVREGGGGSGGQLQLVLVQAASTWTGAIDRDWNNAANWCGSVPVDTTDVLVPAVANQPIVLSGGTANVHDLTVQTGTSLTVQGTLNLYGNLVNNGGTLDMSAGRLDLEGSSRQSVPAFSVAELHVNGGGGFTLAGSSTVSGALSFGASGGQVVLGSGDLTVGSINGGDVNAFVVTGGSGVLKRKALNGTQLMPVGVNATSYTPLTITSADGLDWSVRLQANFAGYPSFNQSVALQRIWHITPSASPTTTGTDLVFTYPDTLWTTPGSVTVFHYGAQTLWTPASAGATGLNATLNGGLRSVSISGQQDFSPFAISGAGASLPVTLLHFSGRNAGSHNNLQWRTASEQNNRGFSVERSYDGTRFAPIGFVGSAAVGGNSSSQLQYSFTDSSFNGLRQFYRLRQEDLDGHFHYSHAILLTRAQAGVEFEVFPSPARTQVFIRMQVAGDGRYTIQLSDMRGRNVSTQQRQLARGSNTLALPLAGLAAGTYLVEVLDEKGNRVGSKLMIKE
ncbi:MAG: HYR domain-containing protein, partial [Chitinophagaceae bacterium]